MSEYAAVLIPQPLTAMVTQLYSAAKANEYKLENSQFKTAMRILTYASVRLALAGALYCAMNKYSPDPKIATGVSALISTPATAIYWGGKYVVEGVKDVCTHIKTPLTREFGLGLVKYVGACFVLNSHNYFKLGLVEYLGPYLVDPATYNNRPY